MNNKLFIIAEAGVNHNGRVDLAKKMIDAAIGAGADAVKFQTFVAQNVVSRFAPKADYQNKYTDKAESQLDMLKHLELSLEEHKELINYCKQVEILFLSTPFDLKSVDLLHNLGIDIVKVPSGEITNLPYLKKIGSLKKKRVILSTGMANLGEIEAALTILTEAGTNRDALTVLHCNTDYPTPIEDVNLSAMLTIKDALKVAVGYSDHTNGIEVSIAAVALGATVIEKHFTLDRTRPGPDHHASLEPGELKDMIEKLKNIKTALGTGLKWPSPSELRNIPIVRKSIVAACDIKQGELFTADNITTKRPGTGISPMRWDQVIGRTANRDFNEDELIVI